MSSNIVVKAISFVQPATQDAIGKKGNTGAKVSGLPSLNGNASVEPIGGNSLPNTGSDVPNLVLKANANQSSQVQEHSLSHEEVLGAVRNLNDFAQNTQRELNFSIDEQTGRTVVKVIDHETKDVIRQIPAEEILALARRVVEDKDGKGNLFKVEA